MKKDELIRLYSSLFDVPQRDAKVIIDSFSQLVEDVLARGESLTLPGIMTVGVKISKPRRAFQFKDGTVGYTTPKPVPFVKFGTRARAAASTAPVMLNKE